MLTFPRPSTVPRSHRLARLAAFPAFTAIALGMVHAPVASAQPAAVWAVSTTIDVGTTPTQFAFSPDAARLYVTAGDGFDVIDTATNTAIDKVSVPTVGGIAVTPDGAIYVLGIDGTVSVIDPVTYATIASVDVGTNTLGMTASGDAVFVTNHGNESVEVIDTTTNTVDATVPVGQNPIQATALDGTVYVTNAGSGTVSAIDAATNTVIATISVGGVPIGVTSAAGRVYVVEGVSQSVAVIDATSNTVVETIPVGGGSLTGIAATADGSTVLVNQSDTDTVAIIDLDHPTARQSVAVGARPGGAIAAPDNTTAYITNGAAASISVLTTADAGCTGIACIPTGSFGG